MESVTNIALIVIVALGVVASIIWFFQDLFRFLAPDNADEREIRRELGDDTPESNAALRKRFGKGSHWQDALTGLSGLGGLILLFWIWFG